MTTGALHQKPEILGTDVRRFWSLTWTLAYTDFKLRFYDSVLGVVWTLVRPFAFFAVLYVVFAKIAKIGEGVTNYPAYILICMVLFQFWLEIASGSLSCLVQRENLLRKMRFPRLVIPLSIALTALLNLGMTLIAVTLFMLVIGVYPDWGWLEIFPLIGLLLCFGIGVGLVLATLFVRYRDILPIWEVLSQMMFYASPILYVAVGTVDPDWLRPYLANPLASIFTEVRHALLDPQAAGIVEAIGEPVRLLIPLGIIFGSLALGLWTFNREAPKVAENL